MRDYLRKAARDPSEKSRDFLIKSGMQINDVPPEEIARMRERVKPAVSKYAAQIGEALVKQFYDKMERALQGK